MTGPEWIQVAGYVGGALAALLAPVVVAIRKARAETIAMQKIPPTAPSTPPADARPVHPLDVLRERVAFLETQVRVAQETASELRARLVEIGEDHARTAAALTREREQNERLMAYVTELEQRRRETDSGYTRLQSYPPVITEVDGAPTPPRGTRRPR